MAISVADNFSYLGVKPLDGRVQFDTVSDMVSISESYLYDGCLAYVVEEQKYYSYDSSNTEDETYGKWSELSTGSTIEIDSEISSTSTNPVQNKVIYEQLETKANSDDIGDLTDLTTTEQSTIVGAINEVDARSAVRTIIDNDDTELTQRESLQFSGLSSTDDSTNEKTVVEALGLTDDDLDDIVGEEMPTTVIAQSGRQYSESEQVVGTWIDGSIIYQRVVPLTLPTASNTTYYEQLDFDIDIGIDLRMLAKVGQNWMPFVGSVNSQMDVGTFNSCFVNYESTAFPNVIAYTTTRDGWISSEAGGNLTDLYAIIQYTKP